MGDAELNSLEPIRVGESIFEVLLEYSGNMHSYARVRDGKVVISIPKRLDNKAEAGSIAYLYSKMERLISKHPNRFVAERITFENECVTYPLGREVSVKVLFASGRRTPSYDISGSCVTIMLGNRETDWKSVLNKLATAAISELSAPDVIAMVDQINESHFKGKIGKVRIKRNRGIWGSISKDGNMSLNFSLLYAPRDVLEYVIVHELSHIKHRKHGRKFWESVEKVIPDYRTRRAWLREHSSLMG